MDALTALSVRNAVQRHLHLADDVVVDTVWASVTVETGWDPPSRRSRRFGWLGALMELLSATNGETPQPWVTQATGEPKWRLVVQGADGTRWAESAWRRDWPEVERLQADWQQRLVALPEDEARSTLWKWSGT